MQANDSGVAADHHADPERKPQGDRTKAVDAQTEDHVLAEEEVDAESDAHPDDHRRRLWRLVQALDPSFSPLLADSPEDAGKEHVGSDENRDLQKLGTPRPTGPDRLGRPVRKQECDRHRHRWDGGHIGQPDPPRTRSDRLPFAEQTWAPTDQGEY